jgi:glycosyltransferase involved in cell wall biosynthesis
VQDGHTGLLAPVGSARALAAALLGLLNDPALAERLAHAARRRTQAEFTVADMARRYVEIYEALLAGSRQAKPSGDGFRRPTLTAQRQAR